MCLIITGSVHSLGSSAGGDVLWHSAKFMGLLKFHPNLFLPLLPSFYFSPSFLLNRISSWSHQKQSVLLKLSFATVLK